VPPEGSDVPPEGSDVPPEGSDVPPEGSDVPPEGSDVPPEHMTPTWVRTCPRHRPKPTDAYLGAHVPSAQAQADRVRSGVEARAPKRPSLSLSGHCFCDGGKLGNLEGACEDNA